MSSKSQEREEKMKSITRKLKEEQKEKKKDKKKRREKYDTSPTKAKKSELLYFPFEN